MLFVSQFFLMCVPESSHAPAAGEPLALDQGWPGRHQDLRPDLGCWDGGCSTRFLGHQNDGANSKLHSFLGPFEKGAPWGGTGKAPVHCGPL